jgi:hypothetical protein
MTDLMNFTFNATGAAVKTCQEYIRDSFLSYTEWYNKVSVVFLIMNFFIFLGVFFYMNTRIRRFFIKGRSVRFVKYYDMVCTSMIQIGAVYGLIAAIYLCTKWGWV